MLVDRPIHRFYLILLALLISSLGASSQVIDNSIDIKIDNKKKITTRSITIQINNKEQRWLGEVDIPFKVGNDLQILEAVIFNSNNKVVRSIKKKDITTRSRISEVSFFDDHLIKSFNLYWNEYPYRIRYSYRKVDSDFIYAAWWYPIIAYDLPHIKSTLTFTCPIDFEFKSESNYRFERSKVQSAELIKYEWKLSNSLIDKAEDGSANLRKILPFVLIAPKNFNYSVAGSLESWDSYGDWVYKLNASKLGLTFSEQRTVDRLLENVSDTIQKIKVLYEHMQRNTKYVNVSIDEGGLEPYPASYVCYNKYGDCKALTVYMMALLKYAGINSHYCLVNAGVGASEIIEAVPGPQFNHVILAVPLERDTIWLENTNQILPFGYLGTFTQNKKSLWVSETESRLVFTPKMSLSDFREDKKFTFQLDSDGSGSLNVKEEFGGSKFEHFLKYLDSSESLEDEVRKYSKVTSGILDSVHIQLSDSNRYKIQLHSIYKCNNQIRNIGAFRALTPPKIVLPEFSTKEFRNYPYVLNIPFNKKIQTHYYIEDIEKYTVEIPPKKLIQSKFGEFMIEYFISNDNEVSVSQNLILYSQEIKTHEYSSFIGFLNQIEFIQNKSSFLLR